MTPGRGFTTLNQKGERAAFGMWLRELIQASGGRAKVAETCGISTDSLTKWMGGRAIPSKVNIQKLIDNRVIPYGTAEAMLADSAWLSARYIKAAKPKPQPKELSETWDVVTPEPARHNLMDAVLAEPGLDARQRAQLVAVVAMVVNGVDVQVSISPR